MIMVLDGYRWISSNFAATLNTNTSGIIDSLVKKESLPSCQLIFKQRGRKVVSGQRDTVVGL